MSRLSLSTRTIGIVLFIVVPSFVFMADCLPAARSRPQPARPEKPSSQEPAAPKQKEPPALPAPPASTTPEIPSLDLSDLLGLRGRQYEGKVVDVSGAAEFAPVMAGSLSNVLKSKGKGFLK